jgi:hypothetical protein
LAVDGDFNGFVSNNLATENFYIIFRVHIYIY